jgi:hypothetical protein
MNRAIAFAILMVSSLNVAIATTGRADVGRGVSDIDDRVFLVAAGKRLRSEGVFSSSGTNEP